MQREGSVTACHVSFNHDSPEAEVSCMYGPNGDHSYSQDESRVPGIPNMFDFCEDRCNNSSLRFCTLTATSKGVRELACVYGKNCD
ncbi:MAG TPA: hypothetical protein VJT73_12385 [Polyangiaceae bacterium]|nr:hypothetical protein [Polyangiaceae bacterium]